MTAKIEALLLEKFKEEGFEDCFLVEIRLHDNHKLEVFVDSDSSITYDKCRVISRYLEKHIEEGKWLGDKYILEVSSPGITRPLKFARQYKKNEGRTVKVKLKDGKKEEGLLKSVSETEIVLEQKVRVKEGKKKKTQILQTPIPFDNIKETIVKISF